MLKSIIPQCAAVGVLLLGGCAAPKVPAPQARVKISITRLGQDELHLFGVGPIAGWGAGRDNTFMHSLELVLDSLGRPIGYDDLMGLSGAAFRLQFHVDAWDAGSPDVLVGRDCVAPVMAAIAVGYQVYYVAPQEVEEVQRLRHDVAASLDSGIPALACNIIPPANWGIITGYRARGREWFARGYAEDARDADQAARGWPDAVVIFTAPKPLEDMRAAYLDSIKHAVELYEMPLAGGYALGRAAFEQWCDQLTHVADRRYLQPNAFIYISLIDARSAAVRYLRHVAPLLGNGRSDLESAADLYERETKLLLEAMDSVPFPSQVPVGLPGSEVRQRQITSLRVAMELERQAVEHLKRVK